MQSYKKSTSHDKTALLQGGGDFFDLERKRFRRSFSQGNIFEKLSVMNGTSVKKFGNSIVTDNTEKVDDKDKSHKVAEICVNSALKVNDKFRNPSRLLLGYENRPPKTKGNSPINSPSGKYFKYTIKSMIAKNNT